MQGRRYRFSDYEADFVRQELRKCGTRVALEHKPFRVLELLLRDAGQLVKRKDLFAHLWPDSFVNFERGLNSAMNSLRQVLGETSKQYRFIETRPGIGYRFIAPVEEIREAPSRPFPQCNSEPYRDCLKGRYLLDRMSEAEIYKALGYFNAAAADEHCAALAHSGIADAYCQLALSGLLGCSRVAGHARSSAESALRVNPELARAHLSSARVKLLFDWDWVGARAAADRAVELDASLEAVHTLHAWLLSTLGDHETALQHCRDGLVIDPLSLPANLQFANCLYASGDFQSAANQCWKVLSLWPNFASAQLLLALSYERLGMYEEAVVEFKNAQGFSTCRVPASSGLSALFALLGKHSESEEALRELSAEAGGRHVSNYWYAVVNAGRRQYGEALTCLEKCLEERDPALLWLRTDVRFEELKEFSRFHAILGRVADGKIAM